MPLVGKSLYTTENTLRTLDMSGYEFTMYWKKKNEIDQHNAKCAAEEMKVKAEAEAEATCCTWLAVRAMPSCSWNY